MEICKRNPYYRNKTQKVLKIEDLQKIPILTREILQNYSLLTNDIPTKRIRYDSTSGSTGQPVKFAKDQLLGEPIKIASEMLFNEWVGLLFGEKHFKLWGSHEKSYKQNFWHRYISHCRQSPPYYHDAHDFKAVISSLNKFKPKILTGYSSALYWAAYHIKNKNYKLKFSLKAIIASAEVLLPSQKKLIEESFNCPVFMRYGTREVDNIGMECSMRNGYHYIANRYIIEVVDSKGEPLNLGKEGKLLVTDLHNHVMPLIRYEIGDYAIMGDKLCACGKTWPIIKEIKGRIGDFLELPSGNIFPFLKINIIFEQFGEIIREFQIIQESLENWVIKLVKGSIFDESRVLKLIQTLKNETNNEIDISFEITDEIEKMNNGKFRYIVKHK